MGLGFDPESLGLGLMLEKEQGLTAGYVPVSAYEGRCKATWKREFKLPWHKAVLLQSFR